MSLTKMHIDRCINFGASQPDGLPAAQLDIK
jgi:hypothetical protein